MREFQRVCLGFDESTLYRHYFMYHHMQQETARLTDPALDLLFPYFIECQSAHFDRIYHEKGGNLHEFFRVA